MKFVTGNLYEITYIRENKKNIILVISTNTYDPNIEMDFIYLDKTLSHTKPYTLCSLYNVWKLYYRIRKLESWETIQYKLEYNL